MDKSGLSEVDIEVLIKLVEQRPSIWDKSCNKDSAEKKKAWREICEHFSWSKWRRDWEEIDEEEQKKIDETYRGKWTNLRDVFIKSIKAGSSQQYKYHDLMKFLLKNDYPVKQTTPPPAEAGPSNKPQNGNQPTPLPTEMRPSNEPRIGNKKRQSPAKLSPKNSKRSSPSTNSPARKKKLLASVAAQPKPVVSPQISAGQETLPPKTTVTSCISSTTDSDSGRLDEDDAFFISIRPHVKKFSDFEKIDFRMRVYQVIQDLKKKSMETMTSTSQNNDGTDENVIEIKEEYTVSDSE